MTVKVNFLTPGTAASELRVLLRQLELLWKFELRELALEESTLLRGDKSRLLVDLGSGTAGYQDIVALLHLKASSSPSLLFATQTVALQPPLREMSGVSGVSWKKYDNDLNVHSLSSDPLLHGFQGSLRLLRFKRCCRWRHPK